MKYAGGISPETLLEDVPHSSHVATLTFTPSDGNAPASFHIFSDHGSMLLSFGGDKPIPFKMSKGW